MNGGVGWTSRTVPNSSRAATSSKRAASGAYDALCVFPLFSLTRDARHNIKKRFCVVDSDGFRYYPGASEKDRKKLLGSVPAKAILSTCELGVKKKQEFAFEVATAERNWNFWALDEESMRSWIDAFEQCKQHGRAQSTSGPIDMPPEKRSVGLSSILPLKKEDEDIDYISSDDEQVITSPSKKTFVEQAYTKDVEKIYV